MTTRNDTTTAAGKVIRRIRRSRNRFFRRDDFEGSRAAVEKALSRLVAKGELIRVRNGLYWRGVDTPFGMAPPNPREVVRALARRGACGPSGLSASNLLGLSTQVPRLPVYAVSGPVPDIDRIRIVRRDGRREARLAARLTESDVAVLEVLDAWESVVEVPAAEAVAILSARLRNDPDATNRMVRVAEHEPARSRVRMRFLLDAAGRPGLAAAVRPHLPITWWSGRWPQCDRYQRDALPRFGIVGRHHGGCGGSDGDIDAETLVKDYWVTQAPRSLVDLYEANFAFEGGTSLTKALRRLDRAALLNPLR